MKSVIPTIRKPASVVHTETNGVNLAMDLFGRETQIIQGTQVNDAYFKHIPIDCARGFQADTWPDENGLYKLIPQRCRLWRECECCRKIKAQRIARQISWENITSWDRVKITKYDTYQRQLRRQKLPFFPFSQGRIMIVVSAIGELELPGTPGDLMNLITTWLEHIPSKCRVRPSNGFGGPYVGTRGKATKSRWEFRIEDVDVATAKQRTRLQDRDKRLKRPNLEGIYSVTKQDMQEILDETKREMSV